MHIKIQHLKSTIAELNEITCSIEHEIDLAMVDR